MLLVLSLITGVLYPLAVTAIAQIAFPAQANGSLIERNGKLVGSAFIGQPFTDPKYFWSRPSATSPVPTMRRIERLKSRSVESGVDRMRQVACRALRAADPSQTAPIPVDLVTASASGLDPHISPAAAAYQTRTCRARSWAAARSRTELVARYTEYRQWMLFGEPRVNVLLLNLALDSLAP